MSAAAGTELDVTPQVEPFTRADYAQLPEGFRAFLLEGQFVREAAPTHRHQAIVMRLSTQAWRVAPERALQAPTDLVIDDLTVLQPYILVSCDDCRMADDADPETVPVLVMEVLSPATARRDREQKTGHYLRAGVAEVWLVDPIAVAIDIVTAAGTTHHAADDVAASAVVPGLRFVPRDVIQSPE